MLSGTVKNKNIMSREIKFRGWNSRINKMIDLKKITPLAVTVETEGLYIPFVDYVTLMQYTGLTDKNGKDIYEGDIIELDGGGRKPKCEVIFEQGCWCIKADWLEGENRSNPELKYYTIFHELEPDKAFKDCLLVEVVGNVFENPELINGSH